MARRPGLIPAVHLVAGVAMTLLVIVSRPGDGDPGAFAAIAEKAAQGLVAYRDFPVEYPPLGLVSVALPRLLSGPSGQLYQTIFSIISLVLALATFAAVYWLSRRRWSEQSPLNVCLMFTGLCLAGAPLIVWRFDILPAFLTAAAMVAYAARASGWTGLLLGLGTVNKLYPIFLGPVFGAAQLFERRWRDLALLVAGGAVAVGAVMAETYLAAGRGAFSFLSYQQNRGVEIESVTGGVALLMYVLGQTQASANFAFGAWQVSSPALDSLVVPGLVIEAVLGLGVVASGLFSYARDVRESGSVRPLTLVQFTVATLMVVILVNKVLSPQYLVWLVPFVPLLSPRKSLFFLAIMALSTLLYPLEFHGLITLQAPHIVLLNLRNALLVVFLVWVAWPRRVGQNEAMFENPPMSPAATPKMSSA